MAAKAVLVRISSIPAVLFPCLLRTLGDALVNADAHDALKRRHS
jgi:hypothetical protein